MGVGKTTVGRALARQAGLDFVDCDVELEQRTGVTISTIFEIEGEDGFRRRESELLRELLSRQRSVIATGGGVVTREENRALLRGAGIVVYLLAPVARLVRRTRNSKHRPLLVGGNLEQTIGQLMEVRDPLYREVADLVIRVDDRSPQSLARRIHESILSL